MGVSDRESGSGARRWKTRWKRRRKWSWPRHWKRRARFGSASGSEEARSASTSGHRDRQKVCCREALEGVVQVRRRSHPALLVRTLPPFRLPDPHHHPCSRRASRAEVKATPRLDRGRPGVGGGAEMAAEQDIHDLPRNDAKLCGAHAAPVPQARRAEPPGQGLRRARARAVHLGRHLQLLPPPRLRPHAPVRRTRKHGAPSILSRSSSLFVYSLVVSMFNISKLHK